MSEKFYTREHEWVQIEAGEAVFGISDHAQELLGDITYLDLPVLGRVVTQGEKCAEVESVKAASDIYAPISGAIIAVNNDLNVDPGLVNRSPEDQGWICRVRAVDAAETAKLMDVQAYQKFLESGG